MKFNNVFANAHALKHRWRGLWRRWRWRRRRRRKRVRRNVFFCLHVYHCQKDATEVPLSILSVFFLFLLGLVDLLLVLVVFLLVLVDFLLGLV
jgi:hypothetical protein